MWKAAVTLLIVVIIAAAAGCHARHDKQDANHHGQRFGKKESVSGEKGHHQVFRFQNRGIRVANSNRCIAAKTSVCMLAMPR